MHLYKCFVCMQVRSGGVSRACWHVRTAFVGMTSGRKELCMVPRHRFHVYGIWTNRSKNVGVMLKSHQLGVAMQVTKGELLS